MYKFENARATHDSVMYKFENARATHDSVMYKFENARARGSEVERVELDLEKKIALVEFKDPSVINNVLSIPQTLDNTVLTVERYLPSLSLKERNKTELRVKLQKAVLRYLSGYGKTILQGLRLETNLTKIEIGKEELVLLGEKSAVESCCTRIQDLTKDLKVEKMDYGTPETASSIKEMAYMAIESIERKHRCGIAVTVNDQPERLDQEDTFPQISVEVVKGFGEFEGLQIAAHGYKGAHRQIHD
ncbi:uncharacterized protein LOC114533825 [Dendronephthya gigantea]|uniref:uncharacterized protein LOC114533825 n=1 Tax=Dendronephthya gigantea TaxID=151771 RepID=UPI00106CD15F|nr:uncharacterized protein LOC114533825 [Dendronephthya gigantea]